MPYSQFECGQQFGLNQIGRIVCADFDFLSAFKLEPERLTNDFQKIGDALGDCAVKDRRLGGVVRTDDDPEPDQFDGQVLAERTEKGFDKIGVEIQLILETFWLFSLISGRVVFLSRVVFV